MWKIKLNKNQKLFFTSDIHYNHENICRGITKWTSRLEHTRDFSSLEEMNNTIVSNINNVVGQDDILICLGDWSFGGFDSIKELKDKIICKNIYLILGNHDHHIKKNKNNIRSIFVEVDKNETLEITIPASHPIFGPDSKYKFVLSHFPYCSWEDMREGVMHLFGHIHLSNESKIMRGRSMDVGVDGNDFKPYELREIINILKDRKVKTNILPSDHHETI